MSDAFYETERAVSEYLLFHYGSPGEVMPYPFGPREALDFPRRMAQGFGGEGGERALDLGCAVGRVSFELARRYREVRGIDFSKAFVEAAARLQREGQLRYRRCEEGDVLMEAAASVPADIDRDRVRFEEGDALNLPASIGQFDLVMAINLIDRLSRPREFLARLGGLIRSGGRLVLASPYTWMESYTAKSEWLGGRIEGGRAVLSREGLQHGLSPDFDFIEAKNEPFLIREHARKFQWSVSEVTVWKRR